MEIQVRNIFIIKNLNICNSIQVESRSVDVEYVRLLHQLHSDNFIGHIYRGYTVLNTSSPRRKLRDIKPYSGAKRPVWFLFSGIGSHWPGMGASLLRFPIFANAIKKCDAVLKPSGVNIYDILTNSKESIFNKPTNCLVGVVAMQIGVVDLLTSIKIVPDAIIGHSFGELVCAYADGCLTAEQTILGAYVYARALTESNKIRGSMANVGLSHQQTQSLCPQDIEVACHNGPEMTTISGPIASIKSFVTKLSVNDIFAQEIPCSDIAYHSKCLAEVGPIVFAYLKRVIPEPNPRSSKWFSTSIPKSQCNSPQARLASAEYYTNNLLSPVLFEEAAVLIPKDAVIIEITPHVLFQGVLKKSINFRDTINIPLSQNGRDVEVFLRAIGKLYEVGLQPAIWNLYPEVKFPVCRGTAMISPLIKWEHSEDWYVTSWKSQDKLDCGERMVELTMTDETYEYMEGHVIDGKNLLPATGYLSLVWETVGMMRGELFTQVPIVFEDVKFLRATTLFKDATFKITIMIQKGEIFIQRQDIKANLWLDN